MSAKLVGLVLERFPSRNSIDFAVAIVLADAADHDGGNIFPSVARVSKLARCSERSVQSSISEFRRCGFLVCEREGGGRGNPSKYRINTGWIESQPSVLKNGAGDAPIPKTTQTDNTVQKPRENGAPESEKGCKNPAELLHPTRLPGLPVDPPPPTTIGGGEVPQEILALWERAAALEAEIEEKQRPIRNHVGLKKAILARYRREGGPEKDVLAELDRRDRKAGHLEEKQLQQLIGKTLKIALTGETMRILREGGVVLMRFGAASAPLVPGNVELKRLLKALGDGSVVEVEKA